MVSHSTCDHAEQTDLEKRQLELLRAKRTILRYYRAYALRKGVRAYLVTQGIHPSKAQPRNIRGMNTEQLLQTSINTGLKKLTPVPMEGFERPTFTQSGWAYWGKETVCGSLHSFEALSNGNLCFKIFQDTTGTKKNTQCVLALGYELKKSGLICPVIYQCSLNGRRLKTYVFKMPPTSPCFQTCTIATPPSIMSSQSQDVYLTFQLAREDFLNSLLPPTPELHEIQGSSEDPPNAETVGESGQCGRRSQKTTSAKTARKSGTRKDPVVKNEKKYVTIIPTCTRGDADCCVGHEK